MKRGGALKRYTRIAARRAKPRTHKLVVRLSGQDLTDLRNACYMRAHGLCEECGKALYHSGVWQGHPDLFHMAHRRNKRMYGDTLDNVRALCGDCHRDEHNGTVNGKVRRDDGTRKSQA